MGTVGRGGGVERTRKMWTTWEGKCLNWIDFKIEEG